MTNTISNLIQAIDKWRGTRATPTAEIPNRNPYGAKIYQLNMDWAEIKEQHARALDEKRAKYQEQVEKLTELSARWKAENPIPTGHMGRGRPRAEHPDEIKILAARAITEGISKSSVRAILGIADTNRLDTLLAEGAALIPTAQAQGEDW